MHPAETFGEAMRSLLAHRLRAALTMLGVIIGVGSIITVVAIGRGTQAAIIGELQGLSANAIIVLPDLEVQGESHVRTRLFRTSDISLIRDRLPAVAHIAPVMGLSLPVKAGARHSQLQVTGVGSDWFQIYRTRITAGRPLLPADEASGARVAVVGKGVAERLLGTRPIGRVIHLAGQPFQVVGVLTGQSGLLGGLDQSDDAVVIPFATLARLTGQREFFELDLAPAPDADPAAVAEQVRALLTHRYPDARYRTITMDEVIQMFRTVGTVLTSAVGALAGIALLVGGIGIMNIMLVAVAERVREIGVRKALGARQRDILGQFLTEAILLSLTGGAIGIALASLPVWAAGRFLLEVPLLIDWSSVALALGFSAAVGIVFGTYPAARAAALDPVVALRHE